MDNNTNTEVNINKFEDCIPNTPKERIIDSIQSAFSALKMCDYSLLSKRYTTVSDNHNNKIQVVFLEKYFADYLCAEFDIEKLTYSDEFREIYKDQYKEVLEYSAMSYIDAPKVLKFENKVPDMIVMNPAGTQRWCDIMVIYNGYGYAIEIKSAKGQPLLNSGMFRQNGLYVAVKKCKKESDRVFRIFMGSDMISVRKTRKLENDHKKVMRLCQKKGLYYRKVNDSLFTEKDWFPENSDELTERSIKKYLK